MNALLCSLIESASRKLTLSCTYSVLFSFVTAMLRPSGMRSWICCSPKASDSIENVMSSRTPSMSCKSEEIGLSARL